MFIVTTSKKIYLDTSGLNNIDFPYYIKDPHLDNLISHNYEKIIVTYT